MTPGVNRILRMGLAAATVALPLGCVFALVVPASPSSTASGSSRLRQPAYAADQVLVRFRAGTTASDRSRIVERMGVRSVRSLNAAGIYLVRLAPGSDVAHASRVLRRQRAVRYAEPNYYRHLHSTVPDDPLFADQWSLLNTGQDPGDATVGTAGADISAPKAWDITTGSASVVVGLVDSGVDWAYPDLAPNMWVNPGESGLDASGQDRSTNGIDDDHDGYVDDWHGWDFVHHDNDPVDEAGHGTHVAGIIGAAGNNGIGTSGVAWHVSMLPLRAIDESGGGTIADSIAAYRYAHDHGAKIINGSFGGFGTSRAEHDAIASMPDTLFVFASGNDGMSTDVNESWPANYSVELDNVMSVAASTPRDGRAGFSNWGMRTVDLAAPGESVLSSFGSVPTFEDTFENDTAGHWLTGGRHDLWEWNNAGGLETNPPDMTFERGHLIGGYRNGTDSWASMPGSLNLSALTSCALQVEGIISLERRRDWLYIEESTDGGASWTRLGVGITGSFFGRATRALVSAPDVRLRLHFVSDSRGTDAGALITRFAVVNCSPPAWEPQFLDGTSMAAPQVTGVAALVYSMYPAATPSWVRAVIDAGVDPEPAWTGRTKSGGRLNAWGALQKAQEMTAPLGFALLSPARSAITSDRSPRFAWAASGTGSGIARYELVVDGVSVATTGPTVRSASPRLSVGRHVWNVVAVDVDGDSTATGVRMVTVRP